MDMCLTGWKSSELPPRPPTLSDIPHMRAEKFYRLSNKKSFFVEQAQGMAHNIFDTGGIP